MPAVIRLSQCLRDAWPRRLELDTAAAVAERARRRAMLPHFLHSARRESDA